MGFDVGLLVASIVWILGRFWIVGDLEYSFRNFGDLM